MVSSFILVIKKYKWKRVIVIKQISKKDIEKLLNAGIIRNTHRGYVDSSGSEIGYYKTSGGGKKRYIQDDIYDKLAELK